MPVTFTFCLSTDTTSKLAGCLPSSDDFHLVARLTKTRDELDRTKDALANTKSRLTKTKSELTKAKSELSVKSKLPEIKRITHGTISLFHCHSCAQQ